MNGLSVSVVKDFKCIGHKTLTRHFHKFLDNPPIPKKPSEAKRIWLKADAKYFGKRGSVFSFCVILFKEEKNLIYWRFARRETFREYIECFVLLMSWGYTINGITSDWHGSLVSSVKYIFKDNIPHQRCLIHLQRMAESLLTRKPKTKAGKELLELVKELNNIRTESEKSAFLSLFNSFEKKYLSFLNERTYYTEEHTRKRKWFYTHKNVRRVYRTIKATTGNLFLYIEYPKLNKDTNGLESEFSHLTEKIQTHRGLKLERKKAAISWYIYLKNLERNG